MYQWMRYRCDCFKSWLSKTLSLFSKENTKLCMNRRCFLFSWSRFVMTHQTTSRHLDVRLDVETQIKDNVQGFQVAMDNGGGLAVQIPGARMAQTLQRYQQPRPMQTCSILRKAQHARVSQRSAKRAYGSKPL